MPIISIFAQVCLDEPGSVTLQVFDNKTREGRGSKASTQPHWDAGQPAQVWGHYDEQEDQDVTRRGMI